MCVCVFTSDVYGVCEAPPLLDWKHITTVIVGTAFSSGIGFHGDNVLGFQW